MTEAGLPGQAPDAARAVLFGVDILIRTLPMTSRTLASPALGTASNSASATADPPAPAGKATSSRLSRRLASSNVRLMDQVALTVALVVALTSSIPHDGDAISGFLQGRVSVRNLLLELALLATWRAIHWFTSIYQPRIAPRAAKMLWRVPLAVAIDTAILVPVLLTAHHEIGFLRPLATFWILATAQMLLVRATVISFEEHIRPAIRKPRTAVICGSGPLARMMLLQLARHATFRYQIVGFIDNEPQGANVPAGPWLGGTNDLEMVLMRQPVDEVVIALPLKSHFADVQQIVQCCGRAGVPVGYSVDLFSTDIAKNQTVGGDDSNRVVLEMVHGDQRMLLKGLFDRTVAACLLLMLSPLLLFIAVGVRLSGPGDIFFAQDRFGLNKRRFRMFKFRSMVPDAEALLEKLEHLNETTGPIFKMKRDPRITRFGAFLRATSLDELPQLINVLRGEMSLVGPRPFSTRDVARFDEPWLMRRFSVKPGMTGLWQVSGRSNVGFDQAIKLDLAYIDKWTLLLDVQILVRTFGAVLRRSGAY